MHIYTVACRRVVAKMLCRGLFTLRMVLATKPQRLMLRISVSLELALSCLCLSSVICQSLQYVVIMLSTCSCFSNEAR